jgi:hypothetical protein
MNEMKISAANPGTTYAGTSSANAAQLRVLRTHLRSLGDGTGEFSVVRDPATQRFVVQVLDPASKTVVDQFPAEDVLKRLVAQ